MKRFLAISLLLTVAIGLSILNVNAAIVDHDRPEIPSFIGYASDRIVVNFDPAVRRKTDKRFFPRGRTGIPELDQVGKRHGVRSIRPQFRDAKRTIYKGRAIDLAGWHKMKFARKMDDPLAVVEEYKAIPGVIDAQPVGIHTVFRDPNDRYYSAENNSHGISQWHLPMIMAPQAWDTETGNDQIVVANLDTGVRYFQKDLGGEHASHNTPTAADGNMWVNWAEKNGGDDANGYPDDWIGWDFVDEAYGGLYWSCYPGEDCGEADNDPRDFNGHGTHCAGIVSAINNNVRAVASVAGGWGDGTSSPSFEKGVKVMGLRIGWSASYWFFYEVGVVSMDYAAEAFYYAANNGARIASCSWGSSNTGGLGAAIDEFLARGGLIFKAAGNGNSEIRDYMCSRSDIISVAATDENDCRADFSTYGNWVDISAPGVNIWSLFHWHEDPINDYVQVMSGTSMATPMAAGVAALIWSQNPSLTADEVKQKLFDSADPIYHLPCNWCYVGKLGAGRINAYNAVNSITPVDPPV
jgi:subtilisin family serine protease